MYKFKFVDLLCGIGGFHQAMASLGGECVFACDIDEWCRDTYFINYGINPEGDITKVASGDKKPLCNIGDILQPDSEIINIDRYRLTDEQIRLLDIWDEFIRGIDCKRLPGFPIWSEWLRDTDVNRIGENHPKWKRNIIRKNAELYSLNSRFIDRWLYKARQCPLFFGAKAKLEWQVGQVDAPSIWDNIIQIRPSGIRVKPCTYFPALVAITQTPIIGKRKRFLTLRECARLQSFPDTFIPCTNESQAYKQFGNAVNVDLVRLFAKYMLGDAETRQKYQARRMQR